MQNNRLNVFFMTLLFCSGSIMTAKAHESRPAHLQLIELESGQLEVSWTRPVRDNRGLNIKPVFPARCKKTAKYNSHQFNDVIYENWLLDCHVDELAGEKIIISGLNNTLSDVLLRLQRRDNSQRVEVLNRHKPAFNFAKDKASVDGIDVYYFKLGIKHILGGIDHLFFLMALLLLIQGFWALLKVITAFTLGHSITLVVSTLGIIQIPSRPVEAIIALSIVLLACELLAKNQDSLSRRFPWVIAALFGLVHGLGFANALATIGLPENEIVTALFLFNIGVEFGQLAFIVVALIVLSVLTQLLEKHVEKLQFFLTYLLGSIAAFWLIQRLAGF